MKENITKVRIIGIGNSGKNIIDKLSANINLPDYLYIDDSKIIDIDQQNVIANFTSDSDLVIVTGTASNKSNVLNLLHYIKSNINNDILVIAILENTSDIRYERLLKQTLPNTILVNKFEPDKICRTIISILISTCYPSQIPQYSGLMHTDIFDLKYILSSGDKHNIGFGSGNGPDGAKNAVLMATRDLLSINISEIRMILLLFNLPKNGTFNEVEDAIEMFKEKYNYINDFSFMCIMDEQMQANELELTMITMSSSKN